MVLSGETIRELDIVQPCVERQIDERVGCSFGLGNCSYDITLDHDVYLRAGRTVLANSSEYLNLPSNVAGFPHDKSTWIREGIRGGTTFIDPGFKGFLTLELTYNPVFVEGEGGTYNKKNRDIYFIPKGAPIMQIVFMPTDKDTDGYNGKYQNQERKPVAARFELG